MESHPLRFLLLWLLFANVFCANAEVKLPAIISDNMVLQQKTEANIWGKATPGETISIQTSWTDQIWETIAQADSSWSVKIKTPQASSGHTIIIKGENRIEIKNVLIGEVWVCSGQSNMDFPVTKTKGWRTGILNEEEEMKDANYPEIRLFHVTQKMSPDMPLDDVKGQWEICNVENLKDFSAVAFFFGRELYKNLQIPVGLIQSTWGGTHAESWTKMDVIKSDPIYQDILTEYEEKIRNYPADLAAYEKALEVWKEENEKAKAEGREAPKKPGKPSGNNYPKALSTLWNGMINPLVPYTIKGVIWYQGESNSDRHEKYTRVFTNMINSWREEWNQGDFPFYFVQIAPHYKQPPQIREAQLNTWKSVKNTGMVVITDVGDSTDIHPRNKVIPGKRLAYWALAKDYGVKIPYSGPLYKSMKVKGNTATLSFDYVNAGLAAPGGTLVGFQIAGEDKKFYPAKAIIKGNKILLSAPEVEKPVAVRYGWDKYFRANLYNGAGLPASPFRTDNWNE